MSNELTIQQAAELLNVSCPHMAELLEQGAIQCNGKGERLRISRADLLSYRQRQRMTSEQAMHELMEQAKDLKMGYE